ncbi:hypothetical protein VTK56DRAFT_478 [Thermocarpiscus australiensis]
MSSQMHSSGRGGAGNIVDSSKTRQLQPEDLQTPTLKTNMVTTGRGGTGNMAANLDPEEKRRRQDVEPVVRRDSQGATHIGRGGTGNVVMAGADDEAAASASALTQVPSRTGKEQQPEENKEGSPGRGGNNAPPAPAQGRPEKEEQPGWAEKGKNLLFGKK